jgi:hypothetical protein
MFKRGREDHNDPLSRLYLPLRGISFAIMAFIAPLTDKFTERIQ